MSVKILGCKVSEGIETIKRILDDKCIVFDYVYHAEAVHEGPNYQVPSGIPIVFIQSAGTVGYYLHIDSLDEDFNRVEGYAIKFATSISEVQRTQQIFNNLLIQNEIEKNNLTD